MKDCDISKVDYRYPRLLVHGTRHENRHELVMDLFNQNHVPKRVDNDYEHFANHFIPLRSWKGKKKGTFTWLVEATPEVRRFLVEDMLGRAYLNWKRVRVADYVGATRCYKCQQYGRMVSYCKTSALRRGTSSKGVLPYRSLQNVLHARET